MTDLSPGEERGRKPWALLIGLVVLGLVVADLIFVGLPSRSASTGQQPGQRTIQSIAGAFPSPGVVVGQPAPDVTLKTLAGDLVSLTDFRGQPVLINFWATWCAPCRLEMPSLVQAYEAHKADGFVILAVNLTAQDSIADVQAFVEEFKMTFPVLLDETGEVADILYQLRGLPTSVFVDRDGRIARVHIGVMTGEQVAEFVEEIVQ